MFENLCTLPLTADLFTQALHPTEPILAVGLSSGHVQSFRLPAPEDHDEDDGNSVISSGTGTIDTEWRTRRHKGSCRTLAYSADGSVLYSAGTDGLLKVANSLSGQVMLKLALPDDPVTGNVDAPTLIHALSPQTLLLATDSCALHLYDMRDAASFTGRRPAQTHRPHDDYISSLAPLPPSKESTSGWSKQWVTTGGTTLAVTDLRRGVLVKSEDQEEELLSAVSVGGLPARPGRSSGEKVVVGSSSGVLTLWERGVWDDQDERIIVDGTGKAGGESLDALCLFPDGVGDGHKNLAVGVGDGSVRIVRLGLNKVVHTLSHDEIEGVVGLGFDVHGRLISGGGDTVKVWSELDWQDVDDSDADSDDDGVPDSDEEDEADEAPAPVPVKRDVHSDSDEDFGRKKKKGKKSKAQGNGILGFKGLD